MKIRILIFLLCCQYTIFSQNEIKMPASVFHANNKHDGVYQGKGYQNFSGLKWKFTTNGKIFSSPAIMNDVAYIGSADSNLYAIDINTGQQKWKYATRGEVHSTAAVYRNTIYFGSYDGYLYALSTGTGKLLWKFKTAGEKMVGAKGLWTMEPLDLYMKDQYDFFLSSPVISNDNDAIVYFGSSDGNIYALHAANGKLLWRFSTKGIIHNSPTLVNGIVYIGSWDTYMYALDAKTGKLKWKFKTGDQPVYHQLEGIESSATYYNGMIYFGTRDSYFYGLNALTGKMIWKYSANGSWIITTAAAYNGKIYFGTSDTYLFIAADAKTGKELYKFKANGYVYSSPAIAGNTAYFGDFTGKMFAIDITSGKLSDAFVTDGRKSNADKILKDDDIDFAYIAGADSLILYSTAEKVMDKLYTLGPIVSSPVISNGAIYFGSSDGLLYAVNLK